MPREQQPLALVGDIGGTNARFALTDLAAPRAELQQAQSLRNADFASMQHAVEHYLASIDARPHARRWRWPARSAATRSA